MIDTKNSETMRRTQATSLFQAYHRELQLLASGKIAGEAPGQLLQASDLISETWIRLEGAGRRHWRNRTHFLSAAAGVMRNILIDQARRNRCPKHGGGWERACEITLERVGSNSDDEHPAVAEALQRFAVVEPLKARLVELRYFSGLTISEVAAALGVSEPTAKRYWSHARAWLFREITDHNNTAVTARAA